MIGRGLFILTILSNYVLSLPVTPSHLESEDVKVMKCIVEALTDVLSRPHPLPVSQECLEVLRTDDRLVSILRHRTFLKELQDIAVQGANERARQHSDIISAAHVTQSPQSTGDVADQSMLEALGGPGERSILTQKRRTEGEEEVGKEGERLRDRESQENNEIRGKEEEKRDGEGEGPHISDLMNDWSEGEAEKREEEEEEGEGEDEEEKRASSEENSLEGFEEENVPKDKKGDEKRHAPEKKSKEKKFVEEEEEGDDEEEKRSLFSRDDAKAKREGREVEEDGREMKREKWTKRANKGSSAKRRAEERVVQESQEEEATGQREVPHHSKEVTGEEEDQQQRSPEVKELQMIARRVPEEKRGGVEEEGSASRKSEEPEIESLAAIESELENVAQKLHELRRG